MPEEKTGKPVGPIVSLHRRILIYKTLDRMAEHANRLA